MSKKNEEASETKVTETVASRLSYLPDEKEQRSWLRYSDSSGQHTVKVEGAINIGSAPGVELVIDDPAVSRIHCEVRRQGESLWVRDLGSKNGTWVNDVLVREARLDVGGRLSLGRTEIVAGRDTALSDKGLWPHRRFGKMVGASDAMRRVFSQLHRYAQSDAPILIHGETGTGKDLAAQAAHAFSARSSEPFVVVDCAAIAKELIEAELFGYVQGAFTGADTERKGSFESADGGTVFLDEIGELSLALQTRLLRVLESGQVRRIGANDYKSVDVRIVSATHRDLREMVNRGEFREDLYFRIAVLPLVIPSLRDRPSDIPLLWDSLRPEGSEPPKEDAMKQARSRSWPGNIRELRNHIARYYVGLDQLSAGEVASPNAITGLPLPALDQPFKPQREAWLAHYETSYIGRLLELHGRNVTEVARQAGVDRTYVHRLMNKHKL